MIYADTDFFVALLKPHDWLKKGAKRLLHRHKGQLCTSSAALVELLFLSEELGVDPRHLLIDALAIADLQDELATPYLFAAYFMHEGGANVMDALHAAFAGQNKIISSDRIFDTLGLKRIPLKPS